MNKYIIDVSGHQGSIDFAKVKAAGVSGVMLKCTEGDGYLSPAFLQNYKNALAAGLAVGAYHFLRAGTVNAAAKEGRWFAQNTKGLALSLGLALDMEPEGCAWDTANNGEPISPTQAYNIVNAFSQNAGGGRLWLYSTIDYFNRFLTDEDLQCCPKWLANPSKLPFSKPVGMVQYSWKGRVDGISTDVDLNLLLPCPQSLDMPALAKEPVVFEAAGEPGPEPTPEPGESKWIYRLTGKIGCVAVDLTLERLEV